MVWNGWVFALAGWDGSVCIDSVDRAPINADGSLGAWQATSSMGTAREAVAAAVWNGWIYILGGDNGSSGLKSVERAPINADGSLGVWQVTSSMGTVRIDLAAVAWNGWVYALGGNEASNYLNTVERAPINADGSLGTWQTASPMGTARGWLAAAVWNGWIYALGGLNGGGSLDSVERAPINADGSLGAWQTASTMGTTRDGLAAVVWNGWMYAVGGYSHNSVEQAQINADGSLGTWQAASSMGTIRDGLAAVVWNGWAYALGGYSLDSVERAPIQ